MMPAPTIEQVDWRPGVFDSMKFVLAKRSRYEKSGGVVPSISVSEADDEHARFPLDIRAF